MKKKGSSLKQGIGLLCAASILLVGCNGKETGSEQPGIEPIEQTGGESGNTFVEETETPELEGTGVPDSADTGNADEAAAENAQILYAARVRHYYGGILSQITAAWQLPDGELDTSSLENGFGQMSDNRFAVADIDGDGREELIVCYANASTAGMMEIIYDYDPVLGELKREFTEWPMLTYYDNGMIKAEASHNHTHGEFWPFAFYQYETESDSYKQIAYVHTWDKEISDKYEGQPFPEELDVDGDGTLFSISEGAEPSYEYESYKYNQADYEKWYNEIMDGAQEIMIPYQPLEYESYADFAPDYLKLKAEEAGRERTDTADDLGLLILSEDRFLNVAQILLSEKYGVELEQPESNFEEYTVGLIDGREVFSFTALDAGDLSYSGEKVGDVTIFGIYPGISVDDAWKKLSAYGFYASPYGEVENCLITGEGFGNISIWFSGEDNKVTQITVMPFCAFAG
ncbi:MAG: hypothetical protein HFI57_04040 [Lachnospiraceae bacterium]|nr:hypothetical protein [Lachnospiraceae bacterium]